MSVNLHAIVRGPINFLHADIEGTLYQSVGQSVRGDGSILPAYAEGRSVMIQKQSEKSIDLIHQALLGTVEDTRRFYLFSKDAPMDKVYGEYRPLARGGDMFLVEGAWWLVTSVLEDFTRAGWVNVRATVQIVPPNFTGSDWYEGVA